MKEKLFATPSENYPGGKYQDHLFDMYKLYVEMTDRISQRRAQANTLFLTLNTALLAAMGVIVSKNVNLLFFAIVGLAGLANCYFWRRLIVSYKQMNSGKFEVIHEIEAVLPLQLYKAEWIALGEGKNPKKYAPFTHIEQNVPIIFMALYSLMILAALVVIYINISVGCFYG